MLGVTPKLLDHWKSGRAPIPWKKLKTLVHEQDLRWDWLLDGKEPKHHRRAVKEPGQPFDRHGINWRFLSLFPCLLGKELGVRDTVFK